MQTQENKVHFFNLDILRFIAVFMVVFFHGYCAYIGWFNKPAFLADGVGNFSALGSHIDKLFNNGDLGVDLFFLISGFLITYLLLKERDKIGKINIKNFYVRRALRIWPLYFLVIACTPILIHYSGDPAPNYWGTILFVNNFETIRDLHGQYPFFHFWSVCVEEHFYLIWPLLIAFVPVKKLPHCFAALLLISIAFRGFAVFELKEWYMHITYSTLARMDVLIIGSWIGYRHFTDPIQLNISRFVRIIVYLVFISSFFIEINREVNTPFEVIFKKYFYVGGFIFGFANYLFNPDSFFKFSKKNILHYFGKISYGIYMYHNIFFPILVKQFMWPGGHTSSLLFFSVYLLIVVAISALSYEIFEKWILKLKGRFAVIKTNY